MFNRFKSLISAMFNKGMSKLETPEVLAEQAQSELEDNLKKLKESLTSSIANEKSLEQQIRKNAEQLETWQKRAAMAVQQNNEDVARQCLMKKGECNQLAQSLDQQLRDQKAASANLKDKYKEIEQNLREFQNKKQNLISRQQASQAVSNAHELISSPGGSSMDKWEEKIRMKEARSEANNIMAQDAAADIQFKQITAASEVDDELAMLKQQMAAAAQPAPKLIEDKSSDDSNK